MVFINTALLRVMAVTAGLRARLRDERGQDLIEYALLGGIVAVAFAVAAVAAPIIGPTGAMQTMADAIAECVDFDTACP